MRELAELIRDTPGCVSTVVPIGNEAYNRLYHKMRSVNSMLAWGHARVIENLMLQKHRMNPIRRPGHQRPVRLEKGSGRHRAHESGTRDRAGSKA